MSIAATLLELSRLSEEKSKIDPKEQLTPLYKEIKGIQAAIAEGKRQMELKSRLIESRKEEQAALLATVPELEREVAEAREKLKGARGLSLKEMLAIRQSAARSEEELSRAESQRNEIRRLEAEYSAEKRETLERLKGLKACYNEKAEEYNRTKEQLDLQMASLLSKEEGLLEGLDDESLAIYKEAVRRCPANPVAVMEKGVCMGCRIGLSKEMVKRVELGKGLVRCDNCMRILLPKREEGEA